MKYKKYSCGHVYSSNRNLLRDRIDTDILKNINHLCAKCIEKQKKYRIEIEEEDL